MKKILKSSVFLSLSMFTLMSCNSDDDSNNNDQLIEASELPADAIAFVENYFPNATYLRIEKNSQEDSDGGLYEVDLSNGFEIDFTADGEWVDVDGQNQELPEGIVPENINNYVTQNYADLKIVGIDKENTTYEIDLSNDVDLYFTLSGEFISVDNN
ncbi:putative PepSY-like beta-lactamase-inhibitor [Mesonia algae]|uniref:Putative PepSY-like beta-lactamase-inhibitor n=1 Tax=Mesonia algae TaxID=213248 RepID=A0A2W7HW73_9FLAO|nr:PepSY-like domain-containing protein [Mesonia algae]PZW37784.1 putative PepSY-like beta-lactamase-inhibitor [Mesonia algae]